MILDWKGSITHVVRGDVLKRPWFGGGTWNDIDLARFCSGLGCDYVAKPVGCVEKAVCDMIEEFRHCDEQTRYDFYFHCHPIDEDP